MSEEVTRGICPECRKPVNCNLIAEHSKSWAIAEADIEGLDTFKILECRGCETAFFCKESSNSEDYYDYQVSEDEWETEYVVKHAYWPSVPRFVNNSLNLGLLGVKQPDLADMLENTIQAANEDMMVFAAMGIRTCLDMLAVDCGAGSEDSFEEKLETLRKNGTISGTQKGRLSVLIDAGNAAAHRGWKPKASQIHTLLDLLVGLIHEVYVLQDALKTMQSKIPTKGNKAAKFAEHKANLGFTEQYKDFPGILDPS